MERKESEPLAGTLPKDEEQNISKPNNPNDDEDVLKNNPDYKEENPNTGNLEKTEKRDKNNDTLGIP